MYRQQLIDILHNSSGNLIKAYIFHEVTVGLLINKLT